tara:strand:- start:332 stop:1729 length:1398 start_codon:yes stop_codon:yes gene_type:complete
MAADQTLIAAAGKMGPAKVDYSGYIKAIGAIGKYVNTKNAIAQEYISDRPDGIDISEMPKELLENPENQLFFENAKNDYNNAVKTIKNQPAFTKKYREAVKKINDIKQGFENVKNDLTQYAEYRSKNFVEFTSMSKQSTATERDFQSDMVINNSNGFVNSKILFTYDGISFDGVGISEFPAIKTNKGGNEAKSTFDNIFKYARQRKESGREFDETFSREIKSNIETQINLLDVTSLKSLAYDVKFEDENGGPRSFMDFSYSDTLDINEALTEYKKENPNFTEADINTMKDNMLADLWNGDQHEKLKQELKDHLYRLSTYAHNNALDYSAGGPGVKSKDILIGREGMVQNWGRMDPDNPDAAYSQYVRHKTPQWVNENYKALNDAMANGTTYTDVFGNTWTPISPPSGTIPLKANKFTITPFNRKNVVTKTNGEKITRSLEEAISDLFGSTRPTTGNSGNNKAKYD